MGRKILFSSIGGNDPVSSATEYDGSALHICRWYKPDEVHLYLSAEMIKRHKRDDRYRYCINKIAKMYNYEIKIILHNREDLIEVQYYDYYYKDFGKIIGNIESTMTSDDVLLANVASGTPAMKSTLLFLATLSNYKFIPIQVSTPSGCINTHFGKDDDIYDVEYYWNSNKDNLSNSKNRCKEVECPNLVNVIKKNIIERHLCEYDYAAALRLADDIKDDISERAYRFLELAVARQQLDLKKVNNISKELDIDLIPVKDSNKINIVEYTLTLDLKIKRKEYGDFIRAISPLLTDVFEMLAKTNCKLNLRKNYWVKRKNIWIWSQSRLMSSSEGKEILNILNQEFEKEGFKDKKPVNAGNLKPILVYYLKDGSLTSKVKLLREVESFIRNMAAHEIISITDDNISALFGEKITISQIYNAIKSLVIALNVSSGDDVWNSYDIMNNLIIDEIHTP